MLAVMNEDGVFEEYNDEFDITIHCENKEDHDYVTELLRTWAKQQEANKTKPYFVGRGLELPDSTMTREQAIEYGKDILRYCPKNDLTEFVRNALEAMEERTGKWIIVREVGNGNRYCRCSECRHGDTQAITQVVPYCWFCGRKMEVENE